MSNMFLNKDLDSAGPWFVTAFKPAPGQQIAICDRCHIMLGHPMALRNRAGQVITVGCDCATALLMSDPNEAHAKRELARVAQIEKAHQKAVRDARNAKKEADLDAMLADEAVRVKLATLPHPTFSGKTLLDYATWMMKNAGAAGRAKLLKTIKASGAPA